MEDSSCSRGTLKRARRFSSSQIHQLPLTPLPGHCPRQDWLRQSPVAEEEQLPGAAAQAGSQAGQSGSTDAAGRADVSPSLTGGAFPHTHQPLHQPRALHSGGSSAGEGNMLFCQTPSALTEAEQVPALQVAAHFAHVCSQPCSVIEPRSSREYSSPLILPL